MNKPLNHQVSTQTLETFSHDMKNAMTVLHVHLQMMKDAQLPSLPKMEKKMNEMIVLLETFVKEVKKK